MSTNEKKHMHFGHRERLRNVIDKVGLKSLNEVQVVEQILTMTNARCDTNNIAHKLIEKFGSLSKILDADPNDLMEVAGVGKVTAKTISYLPQIFELYIKDKNCKKYSSKNYKDIDNFFRPIFEFKATECVLVAFINTKSLILGYEKIIDGDLCEVKIDKIELTKSLIRHNAKSIIIAHNHPYGSAKPSISDYDANNQINLLLNNLGINCQDSLIIGEDGLFSFKNSMFIPLINE